MFVWNMDDFMADQNWDFSNKYADILGIKNQHGDMLEWLLYIVVIWGYAPCLSNNKWVCLGDLSIGDMISI